jgi:hypothetical protein
MLATLLDAAPHGQRHPTVGEAVSIVATGWSVRLRTSPEWGGGLRIAGVVGLALVVAVLLLPFLQPQSSTTTRAGDVTETLAVAAAVAVGAWRGRRQWLLLVPIAAALVEAVRAWQFDTQLGASSQVLWTAPISAVILLIVLSAASARASSSARLGAVACGAVLAVAFAGRLLPPNSSAVTREVHRAMHWLSLQWVSPSAPGYWLDVVVIGVVIGMFRPRIAYAIAWLSIPIAVYFQPRPTPTSTVALLGQASVAALALLVVAMARPLRRADT